MRKLFPILVLLALLTLTASAATTNQVRITDISIALTTNNFWFITLDMTNTVPGQFYVVERSTPLSDEPEGFTAFTLFTGTNTMQTVTFFRTNNVKASYFRVFNADALFFYFLRLGL